MATEHQADIVALDGIKEHMPDITAIVRITHSQFVVATNSDTSQLLMFDSKSRKWQSLFDYSVPIAGGENMVGFEFDYHTLSYNKSNGTYYIFRNRDLAEINMNMEGKIKFYISPFDRSGIDPVSYVVDNKLHIIGGYCNKCHIIFDTETKEWTKQHTFKGVNEGISGAAIIYVPWQKMLYLLGGYSHNNDYQQEMDLNPRLDKIWRYSLDSGKWQCLALKLPAGNNDFPHFLTTNQRYIVLMDRGRDGFGNIQYFRIIYLDLKSPELQFIESPLKVTEELQDAEHAVMTGDLVRGKLVICGYLRSQNIVIPKDLFEIVVKFFDAELVHFMVGKRGYDDEWLGSEPSIYRHWIVKIENIIPSYYH